MRRFQVVHVHKWGLDLNVSPSERWGTLPVTLTLDDALGILSYFDIKASKGLGAQLDVYGNVTFKLSSDETRIAADELRSAIQQLEELQKREKRA